MAFLSSLLGAVGSVGAALLGTSGADQQAKIAKKTLAAQKEVSAPYRAAGTAALPELGLITGGGTEAERAGVLDRFRTSPEYMATYENMLAEARPEIFGQQAGSGNFFSGNTLKALQDRAGRITSQLFGNYTSNLFSLANIGQQAAGQVGSQIGAAGAAKSAAAGTGSEYLAGGAIGASRAAALPFLAEEYPNLFGGAAGQSSYKNPNLFAGGIY